MKAKAPHGTFLVEPVKLEVNPTCRRCGQWCDLWKSQRVSTKQAIFVCSKCNIKGVQLSRLFGSWPPKMFKCMSEDEQNKFWDGIKDAPSPQLEGLVVQKLSVVRREWEEAKEGGAYLPLNVYKQRGFDNNAIEARCTDKLEEPVLGKGVPGPHPGRLQRHGGPYSQRGAAPGQVQEAGGRLPGAHPCP